MKKGNITLAVLLLFFSLSLKAYTDDLDRLASVARNFIGEDVTLFSFTTKAKQKSTSSSIADAGYRVFNATNGKGFVIVSTDSNMPEIIAYSNSSSINVDKLPAGFVDYLNDYTSIANAVRKGEMEPLSARRYAEAVPVIGPLCSSQWGQGAPFYNDCPKANSKPCVTGCVATAMAQIMYYYKWPVVGRGQKSYASEIDGVGIIGSNFAEHEYAWDAMRNTAAENLESEESSAAVAQLCYDCGIASRMNYGTSGSGTHDDNAMEALYRYFGYKASTIRLEYRECYSNDESWARVLRKELDNKRPVLYGGYGTSGGHEFVIDGYDSNGYFHVNWGWDGSADGYFLISALKPNLSNNFSEGNSVVIGIMPDSTRTDFFGFQTRAYMVEPPTISVASSSLGGSFMFTYHTFYNRSLNSKMWTMGAGLFDANGEFIQVLNGKRANGKEQFISGYGYTSYIVQCTLPKTLDDGDYTIRAVTKENGFEDWVLPHMVGGSQLNAIPISVEDGKVYFNKVSSSIQYIDEEPAVIVKEEYFDLHGRPLSVPPTCSIYINKVSYSDGTSVSKKIFQN